MLTLVLEPPGCCVRAACIVHDANSHLHHHMVCTHTSCFLLCPPFPCSLLPDFLAKPFLGDAPKAADYAAY